MRYVLLTILAFVGWALRAQDTMTGVYNERVKSLQVGLAIDPYAPPVLVLGSDDRLVVTFDHLAEDREYLRYELLHCNADWRPSQLVGAEYLDGFNQANVEDYEFSQLTTVHYVHYRIVLPNSEMNMRVSGNYLLRVYPENDPDDIWLQCRFMVSEQTTRIGAEVTSRTDVDYNDAHQQLSIVIDTERSGVRDPFNDLVVMVQQNGRYDNEVALQHPMHLNGRSVACYEHQQPLIFDAGNEYRRFETVSVSYPGMRVEDIIYRDPYYNMVLAPDEPRRDQPYYYDQTQHGRFTVREYNSSQSDIEADYVVVHFSLDMPELPGAMIFLDGDFTNRRFDPESLMNYNRATGRYEKAMLLKQGAYNYQYLVVPEGKTRGYTSQIEGDKYQTVNEYLIKVYHREPGSRADRLIGVTTITSGR